MINFNLIEDMLGKLGIFGKNQKEWAKENKKISKGGKNAAKETAENPIELDMSKIDGLDILMRYSDDSKKITEKQIIEQSADFDDVDNDFNEVDVDNDFFGMNDEADYDIDGIEKEFDFSMTDKMALLYAGSKHTVIEFSMAIMAFSREKNLTDVTITGYLKLFSIFLPQPNAVPLTYNKLKSIVSNEAKNTLISETVICCGYCHNVVCECNSVEKSILLVFNVKPQIEDIHMSK